MSKQLLDSIKLQYRLLIRTPKGKKRLRTAAWSIAGALAAVEAASYFRQIHEHNAALLKRESESRHIGYYRPLSSAPHQMLHNRAVLLENKDDASPSSALDLTEWLDRGLDFALRDRIYGIDRVYAEEQNSTASRSSAEAQSAMDEDSDLAFDTSSLADEDDEDEFTPYFVRVTRRAKKFLERHFTFLRDKDIVSLETEMQQAIDDGDVEKAKYCAERLAFINKSGINPAVRREIKHFVYIGEYMDRPNFVLWELFPSTTHRAQLAYEKSPHEAFEGPVAFVGGLVGGCLAFLYTTSDVYHFVRKSNLWSNKTWYNPLGYRLKFALLAPAYAITYAVTAGIFSGLFVFTFRTLFKSYYVADAVAEGAMDDLQMHGHNAKNKVHRALRGTKKEKETPEECCHDEPKKE